MILACVDGGLACIPVMVGAGVIGASYCAYRFTRRVCVNLWCRVVRCCTCKSL